ncbi:DEAD/DEAH box helicase [Chromohalobacter israelensis]|uniref:DEAD/DEAH box helicase n=1 Tax=Chromohalobacter israelensis TaxID=141390 RepID=UPI000FFEE2AF|nr:ATP-binding domain-containing protein [Chromohalobacter salexigens]RXE47296.1 hypothetical protein B4O83_04520 [Chromohalobacter salexigens]
MEKIIASEIQPNGIDEEIISHLESNEKASNLKNSIIYYGFPVFRDYEGKPVKTKFLILSKRHGVILIQTSSKFELEEDDENLSQTYSFIEAALKKSKAIRINKRELSISLDGYLFSFETADNTDELESDILTSLDDILNVFNNTKLENELDDKVFNEARAIIEGSKALSRGTKRRATSEDPRSKLNILIGLEKEISNFDIDQRKIAISLINGPQRIRGLAGSGKTVVLAMKAAHIHLQYPNRKILFSFYTKSLYGLIKESIARFYRHFAGDEPNWERIDILHAWGGKTIDGVCFNACADNSIVPIAFPDAKRKNPQDPFKVVCENIASREVKPKYDHILIDEAQDLPNEFFHICYNLAKGESGIEKNIVWAYDDLQSIFNVYQRTPIQLFGEERNGEERINLEKFKENLSSGQSNDLVLYRCYRNPLEVLITAHALGFGIYADQPVQMLENEEHWQDVGYHLEGDQEFIVGNEVTITRDRENSPLTIYKYQNAEDIIDCYEAKGIDDECEWISNRIEESIRSGLNPHDILVISLDDRNAKNYFSRISRILSNKDIRSNNLLTSTSTAPPFTLNGMVTLSTVHRAKGNEAAEVFAAGIDAIYAEKEKRSGRNKLFTAFTRTKAWLKVSGMGKEARFFFSEIQKSIENSPSLIFRVPDTHEIETIQRDLADKPQEMVKLQDLFSQLLEQGYSSEQIQMELSLTHQGESKDE